MNNVMTAFIQNCQQSFVNNKKGRDRQINQKRDIDQNKESDDKNR